MKTVGLILIALAVLYVLRSFISATRKSKEQQRSIQKKHDLRFQQIQFEERTGMPITNTVIVMDVDNHEPLVFKEHRDKLLTLFESIDCKGSPEGLPEDVVTDWFNFNGPRTGIRPKKTSGCPRI